MIDRVQKKVEYITNFTAPTGGVTAVWGALTVNELLAMSGVAIAAISLLVNWYYQRKRDKREEELHRLKINNPKG